MMDKYEEKRPWGGFEQFCKNAKCTVKILSVNPGEELSLQYHRKRDEFWKVIGGEAVIVIGDSETRASEGDEFFIKKGQKHRIRTEDSAARVLEISFGDFDEDDIVRLEDRYKRS